MEQRAKGSIGHDEPVNVVLCVEKHAGIRWVKIRDVDGNIVILDLVTSGSSGIDNGTHHKPTYDGPTRYNVNMLHHVVELLP